jgi:uncharacterized delta-60 repeat protein
MSWKTLFTRRNHGGPRRRTTRARRAYRPPFLEQLEDRTLLSAPSFGADGKVITTFSGAQVDSAASVLLQPDGKIVAAGTSGGALALARYTAGGALDSTFGSGGQVTTTFPGESASATSAALQADGKVLVAASVFNPVTFTMAFVLTRYTTGGSPDPSFGSGGRITVLNGTNGFVEYVAVLPSGEIVVAGNNFDSGTSTTSFVVEGYRATGTLDTSFGSGGRVTTAIGPSGGVTGLALQGNDLIVAGDTSTSQALFVVARYTAGGTLDTSFGSGGLASAPFPNGGNGSGVAVGPGGVIVVGGTHDSFTPTFTHSAVVARFTANGAVDGSFGSGGVVTISGVSESAVAVQGDGKVVLAGASGDAFINQEQLTMVRLTATGGLDSGFGSGGLVTTTIGGDASASAVAVKADGKIVAAGRAFIPATGNDFAVARYTTAGAPDAGFGSGGVVTTNFVGTVSATANSIVAYRGGDGGEGDFLVAGTTTSAGASLSVARYRADGSLDPGFGSGGKVQVTFNPFFFGPRGNDGFVAVQQGGKIVLVGTSIEPGSTNYDFALARLLPNGDLDPHFGSGGKVTTFSGARFTDMAPSGGFVLQPDGKIVVAGYTEYYGTFPFVDEGVVVRYNPDGSLDTTFGSGGRVTINLPPGGVRLGSIALEPDGKILIDGGTATGNFLERLLSNGVVDTTFGTGGQISFPPTFFFVGPLAIRPNGKILVGGGTFDPVTFQSFMTVAQFTADGAVDTSYGTGGQASVSFGGDPNFEFVLPNGMTLQSDGKVVVVGGNFTIDPVTGLQTLTFAVARFTAAGGVDTTFGHGGTVTTSFNDQDFAQAVLAREDGKIVVAGYTLDPTTQLNEYALAEYNPDGSLVHGGGPSKAAGRTFDAAQLDDSAPAGYNPDGGLVGGPGPALAPPQQEPPPVPLDPLPPGLQQPPQRPGPWLRRRGPHDRALGPDRALLPAQPLPEVAEPDLLTEAG